MLLPVLLEFLDFSHVHQRDVVNVSVRLTANHNRRGNTLVAHSLGVWSVPSLAVSLYFVIQIHRQHTVLTFLINFMETIAFLFNFCYVMLEGGVLDTFYLYFVNAVYTFLSRRMLALSTHLHGVFRIKLKTIDTFLPGSMGAFLGRGEFFFLLLLHLHILIWKDLCRRDIHLHLLVFMCSHMRGLLILKKDLLSLFKPAFREFLLWIDRYLVSEGLVLVQVDLSCRDRSQFSHFINKSLVSISSCQHNSIPSSFMH